MPCNYKHYPADWNATRARILSRANHKCERCGVPNYAIVARYANGDFVASGQGLWWRCEDEDETYGIGFTDSAEVRAWRKQPFAVGDRVPYPTWAPYRRDEVSKPAVRIVLTTAHLDRTGAPGPDDGPLNCPDDRLQALCQRCHLRLDAKRHQAKRAARKVAL